MITRNVIIENEYLGMSKKIRNILDKNILPSLSDPD